MNAPLSKSVPGTLSHLLELLPEEPTRRGKAFEQLCKWFLENSSLYASRLRRVWLWDDWPGRWGADAGIDLVAEEHDGSLWAIQAKAYSTHVAIRKADIDSFLSESSRPQFTYRLLIATTDQIGARARATLDQQTMGAGILLLADLEAAPVDWPRSFNALRRAPQQVRVRRPRPHQSDAVRDVIEGLAAHKRGTLVMACGTGKTFTANLVAQELKARRVLYLVPSLSLLAQVVREWTATTPGGIEFIAVCSDESVVDEDELIDATSSLAFPTSTSSETVAAFLRRRGTRRKVVFATYQSSSVIAKGQALQPVAPAFDLVIADEAHRLAGDVSRPFTTVLRDIDIRARRRLFMTATPRYVSRQLRHAARERDLEIASMDEETVFGPRLHTLSFKRAIDLGLLSDYQVAVIGIDDSAYEDWVARGAFLRGSRLGAMGARTLAAHIGFAKASSTFNIRKAISFHRTRQDAKDFASRHGEVLAWMPESDRPSGSLYADFVSGAMPAGSRTARLAALADPPADRALIANARCLTEGVDLPALDGVVFVNPRRSPVDIVQAVGRAIRLAPDKKIGTVVIPVFVGSEGDPESAIRTSAFKPAWDVLNALRAHDDELADALDGLRVALGGSSGSEGEPRLPPKVLVDLPQWVDQEFSRAIRIQVIEQTTASWDFYFGALLSFVARKGHARVPAQYREGRINLGYWVATQRALRNSMTESRRRRLESVRGWTWTALEDSWERAFALLQQFVAREGHSQVVHEHDEDGFALGQWVTVQRRKRQMLSADRRRRLEETPGWKWRPNDDRWEQRFAELRKYAEAQGNVSVPRTHPLARWVGTQRNRYSQGTLPDDQRERLEAVSGWTWTPYEDSWERMFGLLLEFVSREGHAFVAQSQKVGEDRLGWWVGTQRRTREQMPEARRLRLESVPGWSWSPLEDKWEASFAALQAFVAREGHARVPSTWIEGRIPLGRWVTRQRAARRSLADAQRKRLEAVPGWVWDALEEAWERAFAFLEVFALQEGHCQVPIDTVVEEVRLGHWVREQRRPRVRARLSPDRAARLEGLPGWIWGHREHSWDRAFSLLEAFARREGHCQIPVNAVVEDVRLGQWMRDQRRPRVRVGLSADRVARLEALPGWKWS